MTRISKTALDTLNNHTLSVKRQKGESQKLYFFLFFQTFSKDLGNLLVIEWKLKTNLFRLYEIWKRANLKKTGMKKGRISKFALFALNIFNKNMSFAIFNNKTSVLVEHIREREQSKFFVQILYEIRNIWHTVGTNWGSGYIRNLWMCCSWNNELPCLICI